MGKCRSDVVQLSAICQGPFMKHNGTLRNLLSERQNQKKLLRYSLIHQVRKIHKTETFIIVRITNKSATLSTLSFKPGQTIADQCFPNALLLIKFPSSPIRPHSDQISVTYDRNKYTTSHAEVNLFAPLLATSSELSRPPEKSGITIAMQ